MSRDRIVIGVTGHFGAGRTTAAKNLADEFGLPRIEMSRLISGNCDGQLQLAELQRLGDELRKRDGAEALAVRAEKVMEQHEGACILDGIKHPAEISYLRDRSSFFLLSIQASYEVRWERIRDRLDGDQSLFNEIDARDNEELDQWGLPVTHGQRVADCIRLADAMIWNDEPFLTSSAATGYGIGDLRIKCREFYQTITNPGAASPLLSEVRMCQAYTVAQLSSCIKRKVGAVITSADGENIIAEGRNEVPPGQQSCFARYEGCFREKKRAEELSAIQGLRAQCECGSRLSSVLECPECGASYAKLLPQRKHLDYCRALHAEERAILQVSQLGGMSLQGSTLFVTTFPCALCAKKIVNCGISKVVFGEPYNQPEAMDFFEKAQVEVHAFEGFTHRAFERVYGTGG